MLKIKKMYDFKTKKFTKLKIGDTFKINEWDDLSDLYIKTKTMNIDGIKFNSVNLTNGFYYYFSEEKDIIDINVICNIEYIK